MATLWKIGFLLTFATCNGLCQTVLDERLTDLKQQPLTAFLTGLEAEHHVKVFYLDEWLAGYNVGPQYNGLNFREALDALLAGSEIKYELMFEYALILFKDPTSAVARDQVISRAMLRRQPVEKKVIGDKDSYRPADPVIFSGVTRDQDTRDLLQDATISVNGIIVQTTDETGAFRISFLPGRYALTIQKAGYDDHVIDLEIYSDGQLEISIQEIPIILDEVVISEDLLLEKSIGKTSLDMSQIKRLPVFLGEVDLIKQVQTQAGVTTVGEIASGFNVRGGSADQNLVLYDDVPVFNTSHALGFFSAFNAASVAQLSFYRGGVPARYGGRVSSVLDIVSREGDYDRWKGSGGIGIISSYFALGGPIKKDRTAIMASARSTYSDWMLEAIKSNYHDLRNASVKFYDGALKVTHKFTDKSKMTLSGYASNDAFSLADDTTFYWRNAAASLRFDQSINERLLATISASYAHYDFTVREDDPATAFALTYSITYPSLKVDFQTDGKHKLSFGLHNTFYEFNPGILEPSGVESNVRAEKMNPEKSLESALYLSDGIDLSSRLFFEGGIRLSAFARFGPETVYEYADDAPREEKYIADSVKYGAGEISQLYAAVEPRLSLRYSVSDNTSLKFGYHRMVQYMHLVTNTAAIMPTDIWQSANKYFRPQVADQISGGVFRNFQDNMYEAFAEMYFKKVDDALDFKDGADLMLNPRLETALVATRAMAYGVEFSTAKVRGRLQGSVNYTYSRSLRQSKTPFESEMISNGEAYPANYDQPHVTNVTWRYGITRRIFFSGNFVYHTGRPVSLPTSVYEVDRIPISGFSERNQYRIPDYHRLDLAFVVEGNHKRKKFWDGNWVFSFYNIYARRNAYSVFFADDGKGFLKPYKLSVVGTVIPSVSYSFMF